LKPSIGKIKENGNWTKYYFVNTRVLCESFGLILEFLVTVSYIAQILEMNGSDE